MATELAANPMLDNSHLNLILIDLIPFLNQKRVILDEEQRLPTVVVDLSQIDDSPVVPSIQPLTVSPLNFIVFDLKIKTFSANN